MSVPLRNSHKRELGLDFELQNELLKLKKKIKQIDFKIEHIKADLSQISKELPKKHNELHWDD